MFKPVFRKIFFAVLYGVMISNSWAIELRTVAQSSTEPKFIEVQGKITGLCIDLHRAIEKADSTLQIVGDQIMMPLKRAEKMLEMAESDIACGLLHHAARGEKFYFSEVVVLSIADILVVRQDDPVQIKTWDDVTKLGGDGVVLGNAGRGPVEVLKKNKRLMIDDGAATTEQNLNKLTMKRARFFFHRSPGISAEVKNAKMQDKVRVLPNAMATHRTYMVIGKHLPKETVTRIQNALKKIHASGELDAINDRWKDY
jgi:polar amino acid transport system substrate-binding protein